MVDHAHCPHRNGQIELSDPVFICCYCGRRGVEKSLYVVPEGHGPFAPMEHAGKVWQWR